MFRVGLLGTGRIGSGFDVPHGPSVQTHLKAILTDARLTLTMISDVDHDRAASEASRFGIDIPVVPPYELLAASLDVICIATPDGTHLDYVQRATKPGLGVVLVEKPLEADRNLRKRVLNDLTACGTALAVHHSRRWIPQLSSWLAASASGDFGPPLSVSIVYGRGFRHNCVHALDLVAAFVGGDVVAAQRVGPSYDDFSAGDPTISAFVTLKHDCHHVPLMIVGVDGRVQTSFEVDIRFARARLRIFDQSGIRAELHHLQPNAARGFADELCPQMLYHDDPPQLLRYVWVNIADHLSHGAPLMCANAQSLMAYDLADDISAALNDA